MQYPIVSENCSSAEAVSNPIYLSNIPVHLYLKYPALWNPEAYKIKKPEIRKLF